MATAERSGNRSESHDDSRREPPPGRWHVHRSSARGVRPRRVGRAVTGRGLDGPRRRRPPRGVVPGFPRQRIRRRSCPPDRPLPTTRSAPGRRSATPCKQSSTTRRRRRKVLSNPISARFRCPTRSTASTPPTCSCTRGTSPGRLARTTPSIPSTAPCCWRGWSAFEEAMRGSGQYGPRVPVPDDAPVQDRMLGFIGRDPDWRPSLTPTLCVSVYARGGLARSHRHACSAFGPPPSALARPPRRSLVSGQGFGAPRGTWSAMTADLVSDTSDPLEPARTAGRRAAPPGPAGGPRRDPARPAARLGAVLRPRHVGGLGRQRTRRVRRHPARRADVGRPVLHRRLRLHADLRPDAHRQHGPRRAVPARRLHRHRGAAADGRQGAQHRPRGRRHAVVGRPAARRRGRSPPSSGW